MLKKLSLFLRTSHLKRAIAKDLGEDRGREVGDDREQDRHPGCVQDDEDNNVSAMFGWWLFKFRIDASDINLPSQQNWLEKGNMNMMAKEIK